VVFIETDPVGGGFLGIPAGPPPILVTAEVIGVAHSFTREDELLDTLVVIEEKSLHEHNEQLRTNPPNPTTAWLAASAMRSLGYGASEEPPKPLSDEEVGHRIAALRRELEGRWDACQDYLASIAWPALRFRITNRAQSFLTNVQVILTFHGAAGVDFASPEEFEWERLKDPDWELPAGPYGVIAHSPGAGCSPGSARRNLRGRRVRRAQAFISPS
jgi:hypothetical protein